jgi:MotA/TolQ/ExbB proton channel family
MATVLSSHSPATTDAPAASAFADTLRAAMGGSYRALLILRFVLLNAVGIAMLAAAWLEGWLDPIAAADTTHLCALIFAVFVLGLGWASRRAWTLSSELDALEQQVPAAGSRVAHYLGAIRGLDGQARATMASALKLKLAHRIGTVRYIAGSLVLLGLIGTVVGFVFALSGVDPDAVSDVSAIGPMVSTLIEGMSVALYTTLVGSVLNIWLMLNHRLLEGGAIHLLTHLVERGEHHART